MVPKELNDWLQVIGLFGVLGGLIFVGLQLRLDRQVAVQQAVADASNRTLYWAEVVSDHSNVWVRGLEGESLSPDERATFDSLATAWEIGLYTAWVGATELGEDQPERFIRSAALEIHANPGLAEFWERHLEHQKLTDPDGLSDPWLAGVIAEIDRLEGSGQ